MAIVQPVTSTADSSRRLKLQSPATREALGEIRVLNADEVRARVAAARVAQPAFAALGFAKRAQIMQRALSILLSQEDRFIDVIVGETGRSRMETLMMELSEIKEMHEELRELLDATRKQNGTTVSS